MQQVKISLANAFRTGVNLFCPVCGFSLPISAMKWRHHYQNNSDTHNLAEWSKDFNEARNEAARQKSKRLAEVSLLHTEEDFYQAFQDLFNEKRIKYDTRKNRHKTVRKPD